jgi:hypothetical protein
MQIYTAGSCINEPARDSRATHISACARTIFHTHTKTRENSLHEQLALALLARHRGEMSSADRAHEARSVKWECEAVTAL